MVAVTGTPSKSLHEYIRLSATLRRRTDAVTTRDDRVHVRRRRLSAADHVAILLAYQHGATMAKLARQIGVRRTTVSAVLRRAAIPVRVGLVPTAEQINEAIRLYGDGWSLARIGKRLHFDAKTIRRHLIHRQVVMRGPNDWQR